MVHLLIQRKVAWRLILALQWKSSFCFNFPLSFASLGLSCQRGQRTATARPPRRSERLTCT